MKADLLIDCKNNLGEGVQWNADHRRVWWTDIHGRKLWSCDADGGDAVAIDCIERLGSFAFDPQNRVLAAFESGLFRWDLETDRVERLTDFEPGHPTSRYNDGRCDRQGRFIAGGMDEDDLKPTSTLTRWDGTAITTIGAGIGVSNSICFSPDGRRMYFADSPTRLIRTCAYNPESGEMGAWEDFHRAGWKGAGGPDGSCVDAEGALWNARFGGRAVVRILPDGSDGRKIDVDAPQVTCACFGGPKLDRLYITTGRQDFTEAQAAADPSSGGLFVAEPGVVGLPEDRFAHPLFAG